MHAFNAGDMFGEFYEQNLVFTTWGKQDFIYPHIHKPISTNTGLVHRLKHLYSMADAWPVQTAWLMRS